jgi:hypothetical protein
MTRKDKGNHTNNAEVTNRKWSNHKAANGLGKWGFSSKDCSMSFPSGWIRRAVFRFQPLETGTTMAVPPDGTGA